MLMVPTHVIVSDFILFSFVAFGIYETYKHRKVLYALNHITVYLIMLGISLFFLGLLLIFLSDFDVIKSYVLNIEAFGHYLIILGGILLLALYNIKRRSFILKAELFKKQRMLEIKEREIWKGVFLIECSPKILELACSLAKGRLCIIISRRKKEYWHSFECECSSLWLSKVETPDSIHPRRLEFLIEELIRFMKRTNDEKFILLDGLEYLILENGFNAVFKFLTSLKDYAKLYNTMILVPIKKNALDKKQYHLLRVEFEEFTI